MFGSIEENRFYYDSSQKTYNGKTGDVVKDQIKILGNAVVTPSVKKKQQQAPAAPVAPVVPTNAATKGV